MASAEDSRILRMKEANQLRLDFEPTRLEQPFVFLTAFLNHTRIEQPLNSMLHIAESAEFTANDDLLCTDLCITIPFIRIRLNTFA
jgi:hypothetical protein